MPAAPQRVRDARRWRVIAPLVACAALVSARPAIAVESGPRGVVRQFCQADALGRRVSLREWTEFIPIVSWSYEPAWDFVVLITGYEVGSLRSDAGGTLYVDVSYTVIGQVSAFGLETGEHIETIAFRVDASQEGWRIVGPPPPPHVFGTRADIEVLSRSFEYGALNFLPNSLFVWRTFHSTRRNVPYQRTADLLSGTAYRSVEKPQVGDVVAYLRDDVPYHVGLLAAEHLVASSTLNAGIVRTPVDAFAGEVRYLRLIQPAPLPTAAPPTPKRPAPTTAPGAAKKPTVTKRAAKPLHKHGPQPSTRHRVEATGRGAAQAPRRTPVARGAAP